MARIAALVLALLTVLVTGCGAATSTDTASALEQSRRVEGTIVYEARSVTLHGASSTLVDRAARFVDVEVRDERDQVLARTRTDEAGYFAIEAPATAATLVVWARIAMNGHDLSVARDPNGNETYSIRIPVPGGRTPLLLRAADQGLAGAFHIVDTLYRGADAVHRWTDRILPPLYVYWGRGITTSWSYYHGERGQNRFCLELLGGEPGRQASSDTDEHDEGIILHEFGHFVMDQLSTDSSVGGHHPEGFLVDPGLAWEEARASWFATSVLGQPYYQDTIGIEPRGSLRVNHDFERGVPGPRGLGSEQGVAEILWDLSDGGDGVADADGDPFALGPSRVLQAMISLRERDGAYPALPMFLRAMVDRGLVEEAALRALLSRGGHPQEMLAAAGQDGWPADVGLPGSVDGKIDGVSNPAPSGGPNRPENGQDAVHAYRVHVAQPARLMLRLRIFGSGRAEDRQDLDLELRNARAQLLDGARGEAETETLGRAVDPGWYIVYVRDGGTGNRVGYQLDVTQEPL